MIATILTYMDKQECLKDQAHVLSVQEEAARTCVILDQTIFYPQGGGQACDQGVIASPNATFSVQDVRFIDGFVHHYGVFENGTFAEGEQVDCRVDGARRSLNSCLHSAGHLLDEAVKNLGYAWMPTKGIHFPGKCAVEYAGELTMDGEVVRAAIEVEANRLIQAGHPIHSSLVNVSDLASLADYVPPNLPENKPVRIVNMGGAKSTPCGGTHVATTAEIGKLVIRYVKVKRGDIKVAYEVVG
ncbi:MAG: alanine--tRNA ligase-related protein [Alphaproteobacteria bacterium]|nr:alanine--tRNA ligase-related protein [Alphaproteobacteria bacterium]